MLFRTTVEASFSIGQTAAQAYTLRAVTAGDDAVVARLIREVMAEFGCSGPGFSCEDPEVDEMSVTYRRRRHSFLVLAAPSGEIVGCGGVGPLKGVQRSALVCELRKMYFRPEIRGQGMGRWLLTKLMDEARRLGFRTMYLETCSNMSAAIRLYERSGFRRLDAPMGRTGHCGCDCFYAIEL